MPRIPNATLRRDALLARLDAGVDQPLTLVAAAPGSGKTALLAQWVSNLAQPVAWLSCGWDDADARWFWRNLTCAVRQGWAHADPDVLELSEDPAPRALAIDLANELGRLGRPGVIVVDDFHLAQPEPAALTAFIGALPPSVRLVLASRMDPPIPLGRLRVQGRLLELRQASLRFTTEETSDVLAALDIELRPAELGRLESLTEGWTTGVHLAGMALQAAPDHGELLRRFAETDRSLVDFLVTEVIDLQPPEILDFLLVTAQLESFDAALCDEVGNRVDSADMLERIRAGNLFLTELDRKVGWYRYHRLFSEFLRGRLRATDPGRVPAVHQAAADAYTARGDLMSAVRHCMLAGDTDGAMRRLRVSATEMVSIDDAAVARSAARRWLGEHGAAYLERAPLRVLDCAIVLTAAGDREEAVAWLRRVDARRPELDAEADFVLQHAWSFHLCHEGDPAGTLARARAAQMLLREDFADNVWAPIALGLVAQAQIWLDDLAGARATLETARRAPVAPSVAFAVRVPAFAALVELVSGELLDAEQLAQHALATADELQLNDGNYGRAEPELVLAALAIERDHLDEAEARLERVMRIVEGGRRPPTELVAHLQTARVAASRGDDTAAADALARARAAQPHAAASVVAWIDRVELRLALERGDLTAAAELWRRLPPSPVTDLIGARIRLAVDDPSAALDALAAMDPPSTRRLQIEHGLLAALATAPGDVDAAHRVLHEALALAEPVGFHRTIIDNGPDMWKLLASVPAPGRVGDYVERLLEAARQVVPTPRAAYQQGLIEPLSDRELTVLRYLSSRLNNTEIARALYLSVNTVRSHVKAIYRKLGINSRREAVQRGQSLGLL